MTPDEALQELKQGNHRFADGRPIHPRADRMRRSDTATEGQNPLAIMLACSDSRVPVELLFDQGIGDLFVIRVAGNICHRTQAASIEYAIGNFHSPLVVVLGHSQCGAMTAALEEQLLPPELVALDERLTAPATMTLEGRGHETFDQQLEAAVENNVWHAIADLFKGSPAVFRGVREKRVKVVGALYHIESGQVEWMGTHPDEAKLIANK